MILAAVTSPLATMVLANFTTVDMDSKAFLRSTTSGEEVSLSFPVPACGGQTCQTNTRTEDKQKGRAAAA